MHYYKITDPNDVELRDIPASKAINSSFTSDLSDPSNQVFTSYPLLGQNNYAPHHYNPNFINQQHQLNAFNQPYQTPQYYNPNAGFNQGGQYGQQNYYGFNQGPSFVEKKPTFEDYSKKQIDNDLVKRTKIMGTLSPAYTEFDDYFQIHADKFFTPETQEVSVYYTPGYIMGIQMLYRDSWGKSLDKETYKGGLHMPKNIQKNTCTVSKLTLDYDEGITAIYADGKEHICYLKMITNKGKELEVGKPNTDKLENLLPELAKVIGVGGSYNLCVTGLYFYYL